MNKTVLYLSTLLLIFNFASCDTGGGSSVADSGIDLNDPYSVLQAIPDNQGGSAIMASEALSGVSRSLSSYDAVVFHSDENAVESNGVQTLENASIASALNLMLKAIGNADTKATVDSDTSVDLGYLTMDEDTVLDPINAASGESGVSINGLKIKSISASEGLDGKSGFAYFMDINLKSVYELTPGSHDVNVFGYFELYAEDENNMDLRFCVYVKLDGLYTRWNTSFMNVTEGVQTIKRYQNELDPGDHTDWSYDSYYYDPAEGIAKVYAVEDELDQWNVVTFGKTGGCWIDAYPIDASNYIVKCDFMDNNGNQMALEVIV